jgi:hypothetical protein
MLFKLVRKTRTILPEGRNVLPSSRLDDIGPCPYILGRKSLCELTIKDFGKLV